MATYKQIQANRRNAQKSTGPKTEEGKAVASLNSITHGFRARSVVLPTEDPAEFAALCQQVEAEYQPVGFHEKLLVEQTAVAWSRLARIGVLEQGAYQKTRSDFMDTEVSDQRRFFDVFCTNGHALVPF